MFSTDPCPPELRALMLGVLSQLVSNAKLEHISYEGRCFVHIDDEIEAWLMLSRKKAPVKTPAPAAGRYDLNNVDKAVLSVVTDKPQTAKRLAALSDYSLSRVRDSITKLTSLDPPLLIRTSQGLRLPPT